jgi:glycosyltransferase involved in cell wall biosynthesis
VGRDKLLELYAQSRALLIPLFDDDRSRARFPSKIGEYLAAARPVVTTHVGEIDRYLTNGVNAYASVPGDAAAYAESIVEILDDPAAAADVGRAGRRLAEERFHFSLHGASLYGFMESLAKQ